MTGRTADGELRQENRSVEVSEVPVHFVSNYVSHNRFAGSVTIEAIIGRFIANMRLLKSARHLRNEHFSFETWLIKLVSLRIISQSEVYYLPTDDDEDSNNKQAHVARRTTSYSV